MNLQNVLDRDLKDIKKAGRGLLTLPPGQHVIWPELLGEKLVWASNNDSGLRRVLFDLEGLHDVVIDGQGCELRFAGTVIPFHLTRSRNIRIRNLTIDWVRPFVSQAEVLAMGEGYLDLAMDADFPYKIVQQALSFTGAGIPSKVSQCEGMPSGRIANMLPFDPRQRETAYKGWDQYHLRYWHRAEQLEAGVVRLHGNYQHSPRPGEVMVIPHHGRSAPAIVIADCEQITLEDVTLHHCGGMGVIAQGTRHIGLNRVRVIPRPKSGRLFSTLADATHFVDCSGKIELLDCVFENQLDDPTNIHGIFRRVLESPRANDIVVKLMHHQQHGVETVRAGDTIALFDAATLEKRGEAMVAEVRRINSEVSRYRIHQPLPLNANTPQVVMRWERDTQVMMRGCLCRGNRARGPLISTLGSVRIEDNHFHVPGSAIRISADALDWFEAGPVEDVLIRGNYFDNCNYGVWGRALFDLTADVKPPNRLVPVHRNIRIQENRIDRFHRPLIAAWGIDGLVFRDNEIRNTAAYPPSGTDQAEVQLGEVMGRHEVSI